MELQLSAIFFQVFQTSSTKVTMVMKSRLEASPERKELLKGNVIELEQLPTEPSKMQLWDTVGAN